MNGFDILDKLTNEELEVIVKLIIEKGWQTESLSKDKEYKKYYPDHKKYVDKIKIELSLMGGNTIANVARSILGKKHSISYRDLLKDVYNKLVIDCAESATNDELKRNLLATIIKRAFDKLSQKEQNVIWELLRDEAPTTNKNNLFYNIYADNKGKAYLLSALIANVLSRTITGKDLSFMSDLKPPKELNLLNEQIISIVVGFKTLIEVHSKRDISSILLGPLSNAAEITGPAYRVIIPAVIYIVAMSRLKS